MEIKQILLQQNPWWNTSYLLKDQFLRLKTDEVAAHLDKKRILLLTGPRRSGKSTIVVQVISHLLSVGVLPQQILYLSFDNPKVLVLLNHDIDALFQTYSEITAVDYNTKQIYVFFDEIQKLDNWENKIKYWFDLKKEIIFTVTGSASQQLLKKSAESLVGRIKPFYIFPMDFHEFFYVKTKQNINKCTLEKIDNQYNLLLKQKNQLLIFFYEWLFKGGYPEVTLLEDKAKSKEILSTYIALTIQRDIAESYQIRDVKTIEKLTYLLSDLATQRINYAKLSTIVETKVDTLKTYLSFLEQMFLIKLSYVFSKKQYFSLRKERKIYFLDNGLRNSLQLLQASDSDAPLLVEQAVAVHIYKYNLHNLHNICLYWINEKGYEVDAVMLGNQIIPVEVKYRNNILRDDLRGIIAICESYNLSTAIVITYDFFKKEKLDGITFYYIPAWLFLSSF